MLGEPGWCTGALLLAASSLLLLYAKRAHRAGARRRARLYPVSGEASRLHSPRRSQDLRLLLPVCAGLRMRGAGGQIGCCHLTPQRPKSQDCFCFLGFFRTPNDIYQSQELRRTQILVLKGLLRKPRYGYCWIRESRVCVPPPDTCPADGRSRSCLGILV